MDDHIKIPATAPRVQYFADGQQSVFAYPFPIFRAEHLRVFLDHGPVQGHYSVAGAGQSAGGSVAFAEPPAAGRVVTLVRQVPVQRATDFLQGGDLRADSFNDEFDHQTVFNQQAAEAAGRSLRLQAHDRPAFLELPEKAVRAGRALVFDSQGNATVGAVGEVVSPFGPFLPPLAGAQPRGVQERLADWVSVKDFGAVGDGLSDDTAAFAAALAAAASVHVPAGTYLIADTLALGYGQSLHGEGDSSILRAITPDGAPPVPLIELRHSYAAVHDLRLGAENAAGSGGAVGIKLYGRDGPCVQNALRDLSIWGAGIGLLLDGHDDADKPCYWNNIDRVLIAQPAIDGVRLTVSGQGDTPNANRFTKVRVYSLSAAISGFGFNLDPGRFNNSFVDCEANLSTTAQSCFRVGPGCDKTLIVNLYTETVGAVPNITLEAGSQETAIHNLFSASAGAAIWDHSGGAYTATNAGFPDKNRLHQTRVSELIVERLRFDTSFLEPPSGGLVALDTLSSVFLVSSFGGPVEARLPPADPANGRQITVKKIDLSDHPVTVTEQDGSGPDLRTVRLADRFDFVTVVSNGAAWHIVAAAALPGNARAVDGASAYSPDPTVPVHLVSAFAGAVAVALPPAAAAAGRTLTVKKTDGEAHDVTVTEEDGPGPDNGPVTLSAQYDAVTLFSNGAAWHVLARS